MIPEFSFAKCYWNLSFASVEIFTLTKLNFEML